MEKLFNRPPSIAEDTLHYEIWPSPAVSDRASVTSLSACIEVDVNSLLPGRFIWHKDPFELKVVANPRTPDGWILEGMMRVGDCVDDEWCVVWLLRELSRKWDVAIRVFDSDGEFLLIEAAEALPTWVKPTNSENRVWIYGSRLHLVPVSHISLPSKRLHRQQGDDEDYLLDNIDDSEYISPEDAQELVRDSDEDTLAPLSVERLVSNRIAGYPQALKNHVHVTMAHLPEDIGRVLSVNPSLVQRAVETFYTRDGVQLRSAHRMSRFPPEPSVRVSVSMTRTAYAQLVGQKFHPPKVFGRWPEMEGSPQWRRRDIGMKIAVGFEILYQESKAKAVRFNPIDETSTAARIEALRRDADFEKYIDKLQAIGYFKGELCGSATWNVLEQKAADIFIQTRCTNETSRPSFASLVTEALAKPSALPDVPSEEEADDWLNINATDFDAMLERTMQNQRTAKVNGDDNADGATAEDRMTSQQAERLKVLATKVESFIEGEGDIEGARFDGEASSDDDEPDDDLLDSHDETDSDVASVDLETDRQAALDKLVTPIDASEYGQMPAYFYCNSQKTKPSEDVEMVDATAETAASADQSGTITGEMTNPKPIRGPILTRDKYDGVDSDDETDEELIEQEPNSEEEDHPEVVGEMEIDMGQEQDEFLEFARQTLGISDAQWDEILRDRQGRGAFIPSTGTSSFFTGASPESSVSHGRPPVPGPRPKVNPDLDSFESVMEAMEEELERSRTVKMPTGMKSNVTTSSTEPVVEKITGANETKDKGKAKAVDEHREEEDVDIEAAMDAELRDVLQRGEDDFDGSDDNATIDYNLIKNFLESFKSQAGLSGPVSSLAGRLQPGWQLPRDDT
ncbi:SGT1-domain-containing protein [Fistulina hepatica ATCC 64428]|uniref:SGT1-domain-containing protein n=1 Tax=Fistulina hepatica ATCC 64428 TaxID=1128425 RepID=A0A0D7AHI6_9AGAR|nr:SGT1-domain-containing protein [Fistulina hepatica ATCC 64428]